MTAVSGTASDGEGRNMPAPLWIATFHSGDATWTQTFPARDRSDALDQADAFCYERHTRYTVKRVDA